MQNKETQQNLRQLEKRYNRWWRILYTLASGFITKRFNYDADPCYEEGSCIVISNHVTTWDPLLLAMSFPEKHLHFVASEHIFRHGLLSKLLCAILDPIPRRKATTGTDTVMMSLRRIRSGGSVAIFGEGDASWNGMTEPIMPATGKMVRASGAKLITYRIEGGYLSLPRWSKQLRRGAMRGRIIGVYEPEMLRGMKPEEINELINNDIREDAWERQKNECTKFKGKKLAKGIESGLFLCPKCGNIDTMKGVGNKVTCTCGMKVTYTELGTFDPPEPFENFWQWDRWQMERLKSGRFRHGEDFFSDSDLTLRRVEAGHKERVLCKGRLTQYTDAIDMAGRRFELGEISNMAMVKNNILLFSIDKDYYEIRSEEACCLRKYLTMWKAYAAQNVPAE